jgi:hypothetical protein
MQSSHSKRAIGFLFSALSVLAMTTPHAVASERQSWSTIAAACTADDGSIGLLSYSDTGSVFIRSSVASATAQIRCPVNSVGDMLKSTQELGLAFVLHATIRDTDGPGSTSRVIVSLRSVNQVTGEVQTYATINSGGAGASDQYFPLEQHLDNPDGSPFTSFSQGGLAYYVDVLLIKTTSSANPGIKFVGIQAE